MSSKEEIQSEVARTLSEMFAYPAADIVATTRLIEDLGLDSIDAIDMAVRLEKRTGFEFKSSDLRELKTVRDIVELLWNSQFSLAKGPRESSAARLE
ncbi:MAG TPA: acyl carrier protein [Planctomycetota bacterium]|nr:acyl carrier protein [Planctomycetota bacterium]